MLKRLILFVNSKAVKMYYIVLHFAILGIIFNSTTAKHEENHINFKHIKSEAQPNNFEYSSPSVNEKRDGTNISKNGSFNILLQNNTSSMVQTNKLIKNIAKVENIPTSGVSFSQDAIANKNLLPGNFLQYLNPSNIIRPISDTISSISESLSQPYQPNNPLGFLNPHYLWKQISDKGQQLLSNPNAAIFGFGQIGSHDYPFPYRSYDYNVGSRNTTNL